MTCERGSQLPQMESKNSPVLEEGISIESATLESELGRVYETGN